MFYLSIISLILACSQFIKIQAEIEVNYLDCEVAYYDPKYFKDVEVMLADNDGTFVNLTLIDYMPVDTEAHVYMYGSTMGQYIVPTGVDTRLDIKDAMNEPIIIKPVLVQMGIEEWPIPPGVYGCEKIICNTDLYPDSFPPNNYMMVLEFLNGDEKLIEFRLYQRIA